MSCQWKDKVLAVNPAGFESLALDIFQFQYRNNPVYGQYVNAIGIEPGSVSQLHEIPFLPIRFFKSHSIHCTEFGPAAIFESSGTTGSISSRHEVKDLDLYKASFEKSFELFYGPAKEWCIIGLLPSYLERRHSSLVYMVDRLIRSGRHPHSGFYLNEFEKLFAVLDKLEAQKQKTLLIGVSFGLLDFAGFYQSKNGKPLEHTIIMETGGMKGRRKEMIRQEMHEILKASFGLPLIHSEYGMTELLSQAYSKGDGVFSCPPWMKIMLRDEEDPLSVLPGAKATAPVTGVINVIDLANIYSCCFIATDDAGKLYPGTSFEVLGRMDNSDLRGCSLMAI